MAAVKGSKQERMIVVPYRPVFRWCLRIAIVCLILISSSAAYWYGHYNGVSENGDARAERDMVRAQLESSNTELRFLRQELVNLEQAGELDKQAIEEVQATILSYRDKIAQLEEDVLFYKQIMSPENTETGLVIGQLDLIGTENERTIRYHLELKQLGNNENLISGYVTVNILGTQDRQEVSIPLRSLSETEDELQIRLQFRYFQNIEGELTLPNNFEPDKVQILAVAERPDSKTVQKSFGWLVEM